MKMSRQAQEHAQRWSLALCCLAACSQEAPAGLPDDIEWRSEHFVYHARAGDPDVCPALLEQMERHFEVIHAATGLHWPEGQMIDYYKFRDARDYQAAAGCPKNTSGCARDGAAYAYEPLHEHELIHTYFEPLGYPPRILSEGVANLLACNPLDLFISSLPTEADIVEPTDWDEAMAEFEHRERDIPYDLGSLLVSHLIESYGWEAFLDLYREPWFERDSAELEQSLQSIYGVSFDAAWAAAAHAPTSRRCVAAWACAAEPLVPGVSATPSSSCGDSIVRSVSPAETGTLQLQAEGDGGWVVPCPADSGMPISGAEQAVGPGAFTELSQGSSFVVSTGDTTLTSRRLAEPPFGTDCSRLGSQQVDAAATWVFQPRPEPYFLRLDLSQAPEWGLQVIGAGPVRVCPSCEQSDECVSIEQSGKFEAAGDVVLHFPAGSHDTPLAVLTVGNF